MMRLLSLFAVSQILVAACATTAVATDEQAIRDIAANFAGAWNRHDMQALSQLFTNDADFVVVTGKHLKGREEIFSYHDALHKGLFKNRSLSAELEDLRFVRNDVAIGHLGFQGSDNSGDERRKTAALATIVVVKEHGRWLVAALHNTLLTGPVGGVLPSDRKDE